MSHAHTSAHTSPAGEDHGSAAQYLTGFGLSVVLTGAAFIVVMEGAWSPVAMAAAVAGLAVVQIFVHLYYFLHMNASSTQRWNVMAIAFTAVVIAIVVGGTLWVMYNANVNMMPWMNGSHMETMTDGSMGNMTSAPMGNMNNAPMGDMNNAHMMEKRSSF